MQLLFSNIPILLIKMILCPSIKALSNIQLALLFHTCGTYSLWSGKLCEETVPCGWSFSTAPSSPVFFPAWQLEAKPPNRSTSASKFSLTERMWHKIYNPNSERVWITVCEQTTGNVMLYQQFFIYLVVNSRRYGSSTWQFLQEKYTTIPWGQSRGGRGGAMLAT